MKHWQSQHRLATKEGELRKIMKRLESEPTIKERGEGEPLLEKPLPYVPLKLLPHDIVVRTVLSRLARAGVIHPKKFNLSTDQRLQDHYKIVLRPEGKEKKSNNKRNKRRDASLAT